MGITVESKNVSEISVCNCWLVVALNVVLSSVVAVVVVGGGVVVLCVVELPSFVVSWDVVAVEGVDVVVIDFVVVVVDVVVVQIISSVS